MKHFLLATLFILSLSGLKAQCTPDPQFTSPGIYPDSATNFKTAYTYNPYEQVITAIVPLDTMVEIIPGFPQTVPIDSIVIDNISGLPPGFTYECADPNCTFLGGTTSCARIYSLTNPANADIGTYVLTIDLTAYSIISQQSTLTYYKIDVVDSASLNVPNQEIEKIEMKQNVPNPVDEITYIDYNSGSNTDISFSVMNLLGEVVYTKNISAKRGHNRIAFDASDLKSGIYLYTIDNGYVSHGKKMMVR